MGGGDLVYVNPLPKPICVFVKKHVRRRTLRSKNTKKSWHPNTLKNQGRVWAAERAAEQERGRIAELQRERGGERERDELRVLGRSAGTLPADGDKLSWMYNQPNKSGNTEDYLLGKTIDKNYEKLVAEDKHTVCKTQAAPKNHVEHEVIPFSIRNFRSAGPDEGGAESQVDMVRKLQEDPLAAIRRRELDARAQLLQNPLRLQQLTRLLREDQEKRKEKKKSKKKSDLDALLAQKLTGMEGKKILASILSGKSKKKKKKKAHSDSDSSPEEVGSKNKKKKKGHSDNDSSTEEVEPKKKKKKKSHSDCNSSDEEVGPKKKKKKKAHSDSDSSTEQAESRKMKKKKKDSYSEVEDKAPRVRNRKDLEETSHSKKKHSSDSFSEELSARKNKRKTREQSPSPKRAEKSRREFSQVEHPGRKKRRSRSSSSEEPGRKNHSKEKNRRSRSKSYEKPNQRHHSEEKKRPHRGSSHTETKQKHPSKEKSRRSRSGSHEKRKQKSHSKEKRRQSRSSSREVPRTSHSKEKKRRSPSSSPPPRSQAPPPSQRRKDSSSDSEGERRVTNYGLVSADGRKIAPRAQPEEKSAKLLPKKEEPWRRPAPERLSEAEKEKRRREMMENAAVRDVERERNLKKHREITRREEAAAAATEFDEEFATRQAARAAGASVQQRIRSNVNNIQRAGGHMDVNFAKR